jgi:hypothetical protein
MTNAVFTVIPIFQMGTFLLPKTVIKQMDKYRTLFVERGKHQCKNTTQGSLGNGLPSKRRRGPRCDQS